MEIQDHTIEKAWQSSIEAIANAMKREQKKQSKKWPPIATTTAKTFPAVKTTGAIELNEIEQ